MGTKETNYPHYLKELQGDEIVNVEIVDGGDKYCRAINVKLLSGKHLCIERNLDVSICGIIPRIKYGIGAWWEGSISKNQSCCHEADSTEDTECEQSSEPTIEWYKAQAKELKDIRKSFYKYCGESDDGSDAYFPDLVSKEFRRNNERKENV